MQSSRVRLLRGVKGIMGKAKGKERPKGIEPPQSSPSSVSLT